MGLIPLKEPAQKTHSFRNLTALVALTKENRLIRVALFVWKQDCTVCTVCFLNRAGNTFRGRQCFQLKQAICMFFPLENSYYKGLTLLTFAVVAAENWRSLSMVLKCINHCRNSGRLFSSLLQARTVRILLTQVNLLLTADL